MAKFLEKYNFPKLIHEGLEFRKLYIWLKESGSQNILGRFFSTLDSHQCHLGSFVNELLTLSYLASPPEILIQLTGPKFEVFFRSSCKLFRCAFGVENHCSRLREYCVHGHEEMNILHYIQETAREKAGLQAPMEEFSAISGRPVTLSL